MTDFSQMLRWNTNFVRGLAQSVLERAKVIRGTIVPYTANLDEAVRVVRATAGVGPKKGTLKKTSKRKPAVKKAGMKTTPRKRKSNG